MHNAYQPVAVASERRHCATDEALAAAVSTRPRPPDSAPQSWIMGAVSWLGSAVLEGFALYGQLICPCSIDLSEDDYDQAERPHRAARAPLALKQSPRSLPGGSSREIDIGAWLASAPSRSQRNDLGWFRLVAVWPRRRAVAGKLSSSDRPDVPRDRSLCNGGVDPDDLGPIPPWFDTFP